MRGLCSYSDEIHSLIYKLLFCVVAQWSDLLPKLYKTSESLMALRIRCLVYVCEGNCSMCSFFFHIDALKSTWENACRAN